MQIATTVSTNSDCKATLHSDRTSKFGHKYNSFQVATNEGTFSLGLTETTSGSAGAILVNLQEILEDINETASEIGLTTVEINGVWCPHNGFNFSL